jgi:HK97 family phage portal protein
MGLPFLKYTNLYSATANATKAYLYGLKEPTWMLRDYKQFADEAYIKNVIANRAINMIAHAAASVPIKLFEKSVTGKLPLANHPILSLLSRPNPSYSGKEFFAMLYIYRQISGNAYILTVHAANNRPSELYILRPDRVVVLPGENYVPAGYKYTVGGENYIYPVDPITGKSQILHLKNFHPLSDWYGLSPIEAAAYSIDQHNECGQWNQALLQNGARPSGAIVVKDINGKPSKLTNQQYGQLKRSLEEMFEGPANSGRPLLLEGGLEWQEMSLSPKDMDFIEGKHSSARDIALAFGVPPQLLGIPGDNTYSNLAEARIALWEQTIIPLVENVVEHLNNWLIPFYQPNLELSYDIDSISALAPKRDSTWRRIGDCKFLTINEKRNALGFAPLEGGDILEGPIDR